MIVQGLKLTSGPNSSMLEGMAILSAQQKLPGCIFGVVDPIDYHVVTYFYGGSVERLRKERECRMALA